MTAQPETKRVRKIKCYLCGKTFDNLDELLKHDIRIHALRRKDADAKKKAT